MDPALRTSATGMIAQQVRVQVIANNLANVNTPGFKRSRAHFEDLLYQTTQGASTIGDPFSGNTQAIQIGRGTRLAAVQRLDTQGPLEQTGRALDLAIDGQGLFQVRLPGGAIGYTRDGSFTISDHGMLVTNGGYPLVPEISVPPDATELIVSRTGVITVAQPDGMDSVEI